MVNKRKYQEFSKDEFEKVLWEISPVVEFFGDFYNFDWQKDKGEWVKAPGMINEYCYFLALNSDVCIKVYSSVKKIVDLSRPSGEDAIRIVLASTADAKPVRGKFTIIKRTGTWRRNLKLRVSEAIGSLGENMECPRCKNRILLKRNSIDNSQFLGCSSFPKCDYKRKFIL